MTQTTRPTKPPLSGEELENIKLLITIGGEIPQGLIDEYVHLTGKEGQNNRRVVFTVPLPEKLQATDVRKLKAALRQWARHVLTRAEVAEYEEPHLVLHRLCKSCFILRLHDWEYWDGGWRDGANRQITRWYLDLFEMQIKCCERTGTIQNYVRG